MSSVFIANVTLNGQSTELLNLPFYLASKKLWALQREIDQEFEGEKPLSEWTHSVYANRDLWTRRYTTLDGIWTAYIAENNLI